MVCKKLSAKCHRWDDLVPKLDFRISQGHSFCSQDKVQSFWIPSIVDQKLKNILGHLSHENVLFQNKKIMFLPNVWLWSVTFFCDDLGRHPEWCTDNRLQLPLHSAATSAVYAVGGWRDSWTLLDPLRAPEVDQFDATIGEEHDVVSVYVSAWTTSGSY